MTSAPRRDLVTCKACKADLGIVNSALGHRKHDRMLLRADVVMIVVMARRVDIICPNCGHCRSIRPDQFAVVGRMAHDIRQSA